MLAFLACIASRSFCQVPDVGDFWQKFASSSPDAYGMMKYGAIPVNESVGLADVTVPLYAISQHGFTMPVSLSYRGGGFRVDESASRIGLGWILNAGGVITRTVRGIPDETPVTGYTDLYPWLAVSRGLPDIFHVMDSIYKGLEDGEPDLWHFSFNGRSGAFYIDPSDGRALCMPHQDLLITRGTYYNKSNSIRIIDEDGVQYFFTEQESTTVRYRYTGGTAVFNTPVVGLPTSWYLSHVVLPDKSEITLQYGYATITVRGGLRESKVDPLLPYCMVGSNDHNFALIRNSFTYLDQKQLLYEITTPVLNTISFLAGEMIFYYNTYGRIDVQGDHALQTVVIRNKRQQVVKQFSLLQTYDVKNTDQLSNTSARLMLLQVIEKGADGTPLAPYVFEYNDDKSVSDNCILPPPGTPSQDLWGYYNGELGTVEMNNVGAAPFAHIPSMLMAYTYQFQNGSGYSTDTKEGAQRHVDVSGGFIQAMVLKKVTYPAGGSSTFIYENNLYYDEMSLSVKAGPGLRIKKIITNDGLGNLSYRHFQYVAAYNNDGAPASGSLCSGVLVDEPLAPVAVTYQADMPYDGDPVNYCQNKMVRRTNDPKAMFPLTIGNGIYYRQVIQFQSDDATGTSALNGKTVTMYLAEKPFLYHPPVGAANTYYMYPEYNGNISRSFVLDKDERVVRSRIFSYDFTPFHDNTGRDMKLIGIVPDLIGRTGTSQTYALMQYYLYSRWIKVNTITSSSTGTVPGGAYETETKAFTYGNYAHLLPTAVQTARSDGSTITSYFKRGTDYAASSYVDDIAIGISKLNEKHIHRPVIESITVKDNSPVSASNPLIVSGNLSTYFYAPATDIVQPWRQYELRRDAPVSAGSFFNSLISSGTFSYSGDYRLQGELSAFNPYGQAREVRVHNNSSAMLYPLEMPDVPVAIASNTSVNNIAYNGFENYELPASPPLGMTINSGNWMINYPAGFSSDAFAGTGSMNPGSSGIVSANVPEAGKKFRLTFWCKNAVPAVMVNSTPLAGVQLQTLNGWTLMQYIFDGGFMVSVAGSCLLDELKLAPADATLSSFVYKPMVGKIAESDAANHYSFYEYDVFGHLIRVMDERKNILKLFEYVQQETQN